MIAALDAIDPHCARASIDVNRAADADAPGSDDDAKRLVFETFDAIGWTDKEAAARMGIDAGQLNRIKHQQARLPWEALYRLPRDPFWSAFEPRLQHAKGLSDGDAEEQFATLVGALIRAVLTHHAAARRKAAI